MVLFFEVRVTEDGEALIRDGYPIYSPSKSYSTQDIRHSNLHTAGMRKRRGRIVVEGKQLVGWTVEPIWRTYDEDPEEDDRKDEQ